MHISWATLACFCHLGFISGALIVSNSTMKPMIQKVLIGPNLSLEFSTADVNFMRVRGIMYILQLPPAMFTLLELFDRQTQNNELLTLKKSIPDLQIKVYSKVWLSFCHRPLIPTGVIKKLSPKSIMLLLLIYFHRLSKDNWPFKLFICNILYRHAASFQYF